MSDPGTTREQFVETILGRVRVTVSGDGPALMFWPSLLMTGSLWSAQVEHFAPTHKVIAVDPPGHGGSEALRKPFTFDECVQVIERLLDGVGADTVDFVGNSWGGMIGATFAARRPERTRSAVLMNATASPAGTRQKLEYGALMRVAKLLGGMKGPLVKSSVDAFLGPTSKKTRPHAVEHVRAAARRADVSSVSWAIRSVVPDRPDQRPLLPTIEKPVTVVAGAEDATFPVDETKVMADLIPGARWVVIDGAAHLVALEVPDQVNAIIEEHLATTG
jgi:3-oxoadipate enol-lactonase